MFKNGFKHMYLSDFKKTNIFQKLLQLTFTLTFVAAEVVCKTSVLLLYRPRNRSDDVVLALTTTGTVKVWTLTGEEGSGAGPGNNEPILENESKQIRCLGAVSMTCCVYNMRTVRSIRKYCIEITKIKTKIYPVSKGPFFYATAIFCQDAHHLTILIY